MNFRIGCLTIVIEKFLVVIVNYDGVYSEVSDDFRFFLDALFVGQCTLSFFHVIF